MVTKNKPAVLTVFCDTHFGSGGSNVELIKQDVAMVKKDKSQWIHLGDWIDAITPPDRRFDIRSKHDAVEDSWQQAKKIFKPIASQCVGILSGNHEEVVERWWGPRTRSFAEELGVRYLGFSGFIKYHLSYHADKRIDKTYDIFVHHGHGMGQLLGGKVINIHRLSHKFDADIFLTGHIHTHFTTSDVLVGVSKAGRLATKQRLYASGPAYLKAYVESDISNYAERSAMYPQPMGCMKLKIWRTAPVNEVGIAEDKWHTKIEPIFGE